MSLDIAQIGAVTVLLAAIALAIIYLVPFLGGLVGWMLIPFYGTGGDPLIIPYHTIQVAIILAATLVVDRKKASWGTRSIRSERDNVGWVGTPAYRSLRAYGLPLLLLIANELVFCALMDYCLTDTILR